jgi:hypothetical protein
MEASLDLWNGILVIGFMDSVLLVAWCLLADRMCIIICWLMNFYYLMHWSSQNMWIIIFSTTLTCCFYICSVDEFLCPINLSVVWDMFLFFLQEVLWFIVELMTLVFYSATCSKSQVVGALLENADSPWRVVVEGEVTAWLHRWMLLNLRPTKSPRTVRLFQFCIPSIQRKVQS